MAVVEVLAGLAALWVALSVIALVALAGIYVAERKRPRSGATSTIATVPSPAATPREPAERSRQLGVA